MKGQLCAPDCSERMLQIIASAPDKLGVANTLHLFKAQGSRVTYSNCECVEQSDVVFLMTKGTQVPGKSTPFLYNNSSQMYYICHSLLVPF